MPDDKSIRRAKTKPLMTASSTKSSQEKAAERNCRAVGGTWDKKAKKCRGGVL